MKKRCFKRYLIQLEERVVLCGHKMGDIEYFVEEFVKEICDKEQFEKAVKAKFNGHNDSYFQLKYIFENKGLYEDTLKKLHKREESHSAFEQFFDDKGSFVVGKHIDDVLSTEEKACLGDNAGAIKAYLDCLHIKRVQCIDEEACKEFSQDPRKVWDLVLGTFCDADDVVLSLEADGFVPGEEFVEKIFDADKKSSQLLGLCGANSAFEYWANTASETNQDSRRFAESPANFLAKFIIEEEKHASQGVILQCKKHLKYFLNMNIESAKKCMNIFKVPPSFTLNNQDINLRNDIKAVVAKDVQSKLVDSSNVGIDAIESKVDESNRGFMPYEMWTLSIAKELGDVKRGEFAKALGHSEEFCKILQEKREVCKELRSNLEQELRFRKAFAQHYEITSESSDLASLDFQQKLQDFVDLLGKKNEASGEDYFKALDGSQNKLEILRELQNVYKESFEIVFGDSDLVKACNEQGAILPGIAVEALFEKEDTPQLKLLLKRSFDDSQDQKHEQEVFERVIGEVCKDVNGKIGKVIAEETVKKVVEDTERGKEENYEKYIAKVANKVAELTKPKSLFEKTKQLFGFTKKTQENKQPSRKHISDQGMFANNASGNGFSFSRKDAFSFKVPSVVQDLTSLTKNVMNAGPVVFSKAYGLRSKAGSSIFNFGSKAGSSIFGFGAKVTKGAWGGLKKGFGFSRKIK